MKNVTVRLSDHQYSKLEQLAKRRASTIEKCIQLFADSCVPDGGGWKHPSVKVKKG